MIVTLPVGTAQVGCVVEVITGAVGVAGCALIVKGVEAERQPAAFCALMPWGPTLIEAMFGEAENGSLSTL